MEMKFKADCVSVIFVALIAIWTLAGVAPAQGEPFPTYGSGAIQVRIYTDYFCPPAGGWSPRWSPS